MKKTPDQIRRKRQAKQLRKSQKRNRTKSDPPNAWKSAEWNFSREDFESQFDPVTWQRK